MRNELYVRNPNAVIYRKETIYFLSPKILALISQNIYHKNIIYFNFLPCLKKKALENGNPTAHTVYANYFCDMLIYLSF